MDVTGLIAPWLTLLGILIPLIYAERWIHQHMYGVGYLLTLDKAQATGFYYMVFFPGVLVHEVIQWLVAGALNVKVKKINSYPKTQENGTIRYDFVVIEQTSRFKAMLIGGLPFVIAGVIVYYLSTSILELDALLAAIGTGDLNEIGRGIKEFLKTGDVWLWLYLMFSLSNGMIPTKEDRQGWFLILGAATGITIAMLFLGFDVFVTKTLSGPIAHALELVSTALIAILFIDVVFGFALALFESGLERWRGQKMNYNTEQRVKSKAEQQREPGSNIPLPKGTPIPSIYRLDLPVPPIPTKRPVKPAPAMPTPSASPAFTGSPARPASAPMFSRPEPSPTAGEHKPSEPPRPTPSFTRPETKTDEQPSVRPSFQPPARPSFAEKSVEIPAATPEKSETSEQPAMPARPAAPTFTPRAAPSGDTGRPPAVAPFRRSGADENEESSSVTRDQLLGGRTFNRPTPSSGDPTPPRRPLSANNAPTDKDDDENTSRVMGRKPPDNDTNEVQYVDIDDV